MCFQEMELFEFMDFLASPLKATDGLDEATCSPKSLDYAMDSAEASPDSVYQEALASPHEGTNSPAMDLDPNNEGTNSPAMDLDPNNEGTNSPAMDLDPNNEGTNSPAMDLDPNNEGTKSPAMDLDPNNSEQFCEPAPAKEKGTEKKPAPKVSPKSNRKRDMKKGKNGGAMAKAKPKGKALKAAGKPKAKPKQKSKPAKKQIRKAKDDVEKKMHSVFWPHPVSQQTNFGSVSPSPKYFPYFHRLTPKVYSGAHKAARVAKMTPEAAKDMAHWERRKRPGKIICRVTQTLTQTNTNRYQLSNQLRDRFSNYSRESVDQRYSNSHTTI